MAQWEKKSKVEGDPVLQERIEEKQLGASPLDARVAVREIVQKLGKGEGYFIWTAFKDESENETTWLMRIPRNDLPEAQWLKNEKANVVHVCRPIPLWEAVEAGEKDRTVAHSGYVVDAKCVRCGRDCPEAVTHRLGNFVKMYDNISKKTGG